MCAFILTQFGHKFPVQYDKERGTYLEVAKVKYDYGASDAPPVVTDLWRGGTGYFPAHIFYSYKVDGRKAKTGSAAARLSTGSTCYSR